MGIIIRQSFWSSAFAYLGIGIGFINAAILMPKYMTPDEIGLWRTVLGIASFILPFALMGTQGAIARYFPTLSQAKKSATLSYLSRVVLVAYIFISLVVFVFRTDVISFFSENGEAIEPYLPIILILLGLLVILNFIESILRASYDITSPNFVREVIYKALHLVILVLFGISIIHFKGYVYLNLLIFLLLILILLWIIRQKSVLKKTEPEKLSPTYVRNVFTYGLFSLLNGLGLVLFVGIDKLLLAKYLTLADVAVYTTALYFTTIVEVPTRYIYQISSPIIAKEISNKNYKELNKHYKISSINQIILTAFVASLLLMNLSEIYTIMPNGELYKDGAIIVMILAFTKITDSAFGVNGHIITFSNRYRLNTLLIIIFGGLNLLLSVWLISEIGIVGAALATAITYLLLNLARYVILKVSYQLDPFNIKSLAYVFFFICLAMLAYMQDYQVFNPYISIILKSSIFTVCYFLFLWLLKPSNEIDQLLEKVKKTITVKIRKS